MVLVILSSSTIPILYPHNSIMFNHHDSSSTNENMWPTSRNHIPRAPSRPPLTSISDPSQYSSGAPLLDLGHPSHLISSALTSPKPYGSRIDVSNADSSSAQSTPIRCGLQVSNVAASSGCTLTGLSSRHGRGRDGASPRVSRSISWPITDRLSANGEDSSLWNDDNVQVLILIRPLNYTEKMSQGNEKCLRQESTQTVVWLGNSEPRFTFDHIACESISQEMLFQVAGLPMVDNCMHGFNSCMFAYGQTGNGKTYTLTGKIDDIKGKLSDDRGITTRILESLFARIVKEEENRNHERLIYRCKCSFLEIYNEQITDLLEPSSVNLQIQLREDTKKGVYVENLTEYSVRTVNDVLKILQKGTTNRKIAASYMNSESSRSHSVFTCIIESRWEKDSVAHIRFRKLNLVDLAGSERQKSSGAEGDCLKEAENINKSLSTLGSVIMSLVDLAQGKHRHIPYRDSRLTFLLQDSLGGNSKTTIIANVSPSMCSANETLSTLKFAQRAKLIQNNAIINEDASGCAVTLQKHIQQLKDQLSLLMKHQNDSTQIVDLCALTNLRSLGYFSENLEPSEEISGYNECKTPKATIMKVHSEKSAEAEIESLKAEIEHLNILAHHGEEEARHAKMMLKFKEDKIKRLELLLDGLLPVDRFYLEDNIALREENLQLQANTRKNPEVIRLELENIRLFAQLKVFQDFYKQGVRHILLADKSDNHQEPKFAKELTECKVMNSNLMRDVDKLRDQLARSSADHDAFKSVQTNYMHKVLQSSDSSYSKTLNNQPRDEVMCSKNSEKMESTVSIGCDKVQKQLKDAQSFIKSTKLERSLSISELECTQTENWCLNKMVDAGRVTNGKFIDQREDDKATDSIVQVDENEISGILALQAKLGKLFKDLMDAEILARQRLEDCATQNSEDCQSELACNYAEVGISQTIIHLQEEICRLQSEFKVRLCSMAEQNKFLRNSVAAKEDEMRFLCAEWEKATLELTTFLIGGSRSLKDVSNQINGISTSFPNVNDWISERVSVAAKICIEKEETILQLQKCLEDAQNSVMQLEHKLCSLKDATVALTELQQTENSLNREDFQLSRLENLSIEVNNFSESELPTGKGHVNESQVNPHILVENKITDYSTLIGSLSSFHRRAFAVADADSQIKLATLIVGEAEDAVIRCCADAKTFYLTLFSDTLNAMSMCKDFVHDLWNDANEMRKDMKQYISNQDRLQNFIGNIPSCIPLGHENIETAGSNVNQAIGIMQTCFCGMVSSFEDLVCKALQNDINFIAVQCQTKEFSQKLQMLSGSSSSDTSSLEKHCLVGDNSEISQVHLDEKSRVLPRKFKSKECQVSLSDKENEGLNPINDVPDVRSTDLMRELERKDVLLKGLLFDFTLLQEFALQRKGVKDELEKLIFTTSKIEHELHITRVQLDNVLVQNKQLESDLSDAELALCKSETELELAKGELQAFSKQNSELKDLLKDACLRKSETEKLLEDEREATKSLEREIILVGSLPGEQLVSSVENIHVPLLELTTERDQLVEKLSSLQDDLNSMCAVADENQAIAMEARQESETSKLYAEQKQEEIKILECSVEELESTVNVMEKKVHEMEMEVEKQKMLQVSQEMELQALRHRLLTVEDLTGSILYENSSTSQLEDLLSKNLYGRSLDVNEAHRQIRILEVENKKQANEIRLLKDYIAELILHAEAQAGQYQQKYNTLEAMLHEVQTDLTNISSASTIGRDDRISAGTRGSSSPFKCFAGLVHQLNQEKDQELSSARHRIEELQALAANRHKEVCMLNTRLAATENMTHDVIRDLLSVKLDISSYANIIDQHQLQKLIEEAQHHRQEFVLLEQEIVNLRSQIADLLEERYRCIAETDNLKADQLASQIILEQLHEQNQLVIAQNEMLEMDKSNLQKKVAELDEVMKKQFSKQCSSQSCNQPHTSRFARSAFKNQ